MRIASLFLLCVAIPLFSASLVNASAAQDYWVSYQVTESVRSLPTDPWVVRYSEPFGVRTGYGSGVVQSYKTISDPAEPNCYGFSFDATSASGMDSLNEELSISRWHGDVFCTPSDPARIEVLGTIDVSVVQNQTTTLRFPFLADQEVKIELTPSWRPIP